MNPLISPEFVGFRRAAFFGTIFGSTAVGVWLLWQSFRPEGIGPLEWVQLVLFVFLFQQIATGFCLAAFGFVAHQLKDPARIELTAGDDEGPGDAPTALVVPIFNEDVGRVFRGIEAMWQGLGAAGGTGAIDVFILSDSNRPESWLAEEMAWLDLCSRHNAFGRMFYRKRRVPRNSKSGNVADFCRRWGAKYRYMIVLDADSIMTGRLIHKLVALMEKNPRVGLIQTVPNLALGRTPFRRMQQFAARVYAPIFAAGSNFWQLFGANYWGHNAIIRVRPFMEHCDLPELPEPDAGKRHIFSHDTVEAALMRKAGYDVWLAATEEGSYEEGPPNLADSLGRDRRWCMGNLQHFWFLFAPGIDFANRFHIWTGVMSYLSSPLWLLLLIVGTIDVALKNRFSLLSALPGSEFSFSGGAVTVLLAATFSLLFVPKILGLAATMPRAKNFGGVVRLIGGSLIETAVWTLLAPAIMLFYTRFILLNVLGLRVTWAGQNRSDDIGPTLGESVRLFWLPPFCAVLASAALIIWSPNELLLLSPILLGWLLCPVIAWATASPALGDRLRSLGLFLTPDEDPALAPAELRQVAEGNAFESSGWDFPHGGLARAIIDPVSHALHVSLLRQRQLSGSSSEENRRRLLEEGPDSLTAAARYAILWDPESLRWLHHEIWSRSRKDLHPWWAKHTAGWF